MSIIENNQFYCIQIKYTGNLLLPAGELSISYFISFDPFDTVPIFNVQNTTIIKDYNTYPSIFNDLNQAKDICQKLKRFLSVYQSTIGLSPWLRGDIYKFSKNYITFYPKVIRWDHKIFVRDLANYQMIISDDSIAQTIKKNSLIQEQNHKL